MGWGQSHTMNKFILTISACLLFTASSYARVEKVFNSSSTGTTSATVFVPKGAGVAEVKNLSWRTDSGVTTAFVGEYIGQKQYGITSATASAASVLWFANVNTAVSAGSFVIFWDKSADLYFLRRVSAATTTSVTLYSSIAVTTVVSDDLVFGTFPVVNMPVGILTGAAFGGVQAWFPVEMPTALVIDGNTTSCAISVSGARGDRN